MVSQKSLARYLNLYEKILKSGKNITQIKLMTIKQYNQAFGTKIRKKSSLIAQRKRLVNQIKNNLDDIVYGYVEKEKIKSSNYKTYLYKESYDLFKIKKEPKEIDSVKGAKKIRKKGEYGVIKIIDMKNNNEYFIKYDTELSLRNRLKSLRKEYNIKSYYSVFLGSYMRKTHITDEFKKRLAKVK